MSQPTPIVASHSPNSARGLPAVGHISPLGRFLESIVTRGPLLSRILLALMAVLVVADFFVPNKYDRFVWETWSGFGAVYGIVSCVLIVVVSKFLGYRFLYRKQDYYDNESAPNGLIGDPAARELGDD